MNIKEFEKENKGPGGEEEEDRCWGFDASSVSAPHENINDVRFQ